MTHDTAFTTEDLRNIISRASSSFRDGKIDSKTAKRLNKTAERASRGLRAEIRAAEVGGACDEQVERQTATAIAELREADEMLKTIGI